MPKTLSAALDAAVAVENVGNISTMVLVEPRLTEPVAFCTWDDPVEFDGVVYSPEDGTGLTEITAAIGTQVGKMGFTGLLGGRVTKDDLRHYWPGATLTVFNVIPVQSFETLTWSASVVDEYLRRGDLGNAKILSEIDFTSEFRSISQKAGVAVPGAMLRKCRFRFTVDDGFSSRCPVELASVQHTVDVLDVSADGKTLVLDLTLTEGYLDRGWIEAAEGANLNVWPMPITSHSQSGAEATVTILEGFPFTLVDGTSMKVTEGCRKTWPDCKRHNPAGGGKTAGWPYGGFKDLLGDDKLRLRVL